MWGVNWGFSWVKIFTQRVYESLPVYLFFFEISFEISLECTVYRTAYAYNKNQEKQETIKYINKEKTEVARCYLFYYLF